MLMRLKQFHCFVSLLFHDVRRSLKRFGLIFRDHANITSNLDDTCAVSRDPRVGRKH